MQFIPTVFVIQIPDYHQLGESCGVAVPYRRLPGGTFLFLFSLLHYFSPAVNSSPLSPQCELDRLRIVLVSPRNPLNIGAAARAMSNFGFLHLRVVNPYELAFREARSAVGAAPLLARAEEFKTLAEAVADCTLVVGTTAVGLRQLQHSVRRLVRRLHLSATDAELTLGILRQIFWKLVSDKTPLP